MEVSPEDEHNDREVLVEVKAPSTASDDEELTCSLYVSRVGINQSVAIPEGTDLIKETLEDAIRSAVPSAGWQVSETSCGLIAAFAREADAEKLLQRGDLARIFQGPIQVRYMFDH